MYCTKCGTPLDDSGICPVCGPAPAPMPPEDLAASPVEGRLKTAFSDTLFLITAILLCVITALSLVDFSLANVLAAVPNILFIISMCMLYSTSKSADSPVSRSGMKIAHGTAIAIYIIGWVAFVSLALLTVVVFIAYITDSVNYAVFDVLYDSLPGISGITANVLMAVIGITLVLLTVFTVVVNTFLYGNMKKFALSLRTSADTGVWDIQKAKALRTWLIVLGIINAAAILITGVISAVFTHSGSVLDFISVILSAASYIITGVWITRHFVDLKSAEL